MLRTDDTWQRERVLRDQHGARPELCAADAAAGGDGDPRREGGAEAGHQQGQAEAARSRPLVTRHKHRHAR